MHAFFTQSQRYRPLILEIDTTKPGSASNTFILPLRSGYSYNFIVEWGDGSIERVVTDGNITHVYPTSGVYLVKIHGAGPGRQFPAIYFNNGGDRRKLLSVKSFGDIKWVDLQGAFFGCLNLTSIPKDKFDTVGVSNFTSMFYNCSSFNQQITNLNTASVFTLSRLFTNCSAYNQEILFSTKGCVSFDTTFYGCTAFKQNLNHLDITSLANAADMLGNTNINDTGTTTRYDALLTAWAAQDFKPNVPFHAGSAKYSAAGAAARATLVAAGWTITDGGLA